MNGIHAMKERGGDRQVKGGLKMNSSLIMTQSLNHPGARVRC